MKEAMFYKRIKDDLVQCGLCPHFCVIKPGARGKCAVRENQKGSLYALTYGKPVSTGIDPIEKKPLYHFYPGTDSYSIACVGCNMSCVFCQNSDISQMPRDQGKIIGTELKPEEAVYEAIENHCKSISYTYTEPTIFFEYCYDIARLAEKKDLKNVFVTNGFISKEAIETIAPVLHAANIDLKGFSEEYYKKICGARLQPVLEAIKLYYEKGVHLEITTLVVPGQNDDEATLRKIAKFIASVDKKIPWHISRFFPRYKMLNVPPTAEAKIMKAMEIGKKAGLEYVYPGNIFEEDNNTYCKNCKKQLIVRHGYTIAENNLNKIRCKFCGAKSDIIN